MGTYLKILVVVTAAAAALLGNWDLTTSADYRIARDYAGDAGLPGAPRWVSATAVERSIGRLTGAGRDAYERVLGRDDALIGLTLIAFLGVALLAARGLAHPAWAGALILVALLAAASDWTENHLLRQLLQDDANRSFARAAWATRAKWLFLLSSLGLALVEISLMLGRGRAWWTALFVDVPRLVDSAARRIDFRLHKEYRYDAARGDVARRPLWRRPAMWLYAVTVLFASFGPMWDGVCTIRPPTGPRVVLGLALIASVVALISMIAGAIGWLEGRLDARFGAPPPDVDRRERRRITTLAMCASGILTLAPVATAGYAFVKTARDPGVCLVARESPESLWRIAVCAAAIALFMVVWRRWKWTPALMWTQAALLLGLAIVHWRFLAPDGAHAAAQVPYRHLFGVLAPALLVVTFGLAPLVARVIFEPGPWIRRALGLGISPETARQFRERLPRRELFVDDRRNDPEPTFARIVQAFVHGTLYRGLLFLLLPSLVGFVVPADWLFALTMAAFVFSALLMTWASMTSRWQELAQHLERWFLCGTPFVISILVIAIALARLFGVDYVTTILDAAPFGALFGVVLMSYVLSWLAEYWINRLAALELLRVLGAESGQDTLRYDLVTPDPTVRVGPGDRYLMSHGLGRFLVVGRLLEEEPMVGGATVLRPAISDRQPAFHSSDLLGVFRALAGPRDHDRVMEVRRHLDLYFYSVNVLLILVLGLFILTHVRLEDGVKADAVVTAQSSVPREQLIDLSGSLIAEDGQTRPVVVVVASGGGTRAALYTAHVLEGLHRLGVDRDVVLASGVSGGGVALAYFAKNFVDLRDDHSAERTPWKEFLERAAKPFIQDVLGGASEWRIFDSAPLTMLLAESFDRRLWGNGHPTFAELSGALPLILNTTVVGHPLEESAVLGRTLNKADGTPPAVCRERQRPYRMINGGRLIFTNLRNTERFPTPGSAIPDTRLPYVILQDPKVPLASASALNANFPPVFPNARVVVKSGGDCPEASYFVTDGGAEENLGLVSALFAVQGALKDLGGRKCPAVPGERCPLRPIHFVIAEASAASYDYEQDRGISAALSGAKERMTGGLSEQLIRETRDVYSGLIGRDATKLVRFHYLALPLAFRARGGFGTHWMHADEITMRDPRERKPPRWWHRVLPPSDQASVTLDRAGVRELWGALHDPGTDFCFDEPRFEHPAADAVKRWICGEWRFENPISPRDIHIEEWRQLVDELA